MLSLDTRLYLIVAKSIGKFRIQIASQNHIITEYSLDFSGQTKASGMQKSSKNKAIVMKASHGL
jgi:hypothetical protein